MNFNFDWISLALLLVISFYHVFHYYSFSFEDLLAIFFSLGVPN